MRRFAKLPYSTLKIDGLHTPLKEPNYGIQAYNPKLRPRLFTEFDEEENLDSLIAKLESFEQGKEHGRLQEKINVASPVPEGQFRIHRKVYQHMLS